jgi:NADPH-dependent 2,4-dienoyl-CoA reductase/sulfur reductase-like enzyme
MLVYFVIFCVFFSANSKYDVVVIGAGIIGLATARELNIRYPILSFAVIEKENKVGKYLIALLFSSLDSDYS